jgi:hypothetical protein
MLRNKLPSRIEPPAKRPLAIDLSAPTMVLNKLKSRAELAKELFLLTATRAQLRIFPPNNFAELTTLVSGRH